jgi:ankyrin repeat protein
MIAAGIGRTAERSEEEEKSALETVRLAVELGAGVNRADEFGQTPLHAASYIGSDGIIEFLVGKGARLDAVDSYGMTPLAIAEAITQGNLPRNKRIRRPHPETANLIRRLGANSASD